MTTATTRVARVRVALRPIPMNVNVNATARSIGRADTHPHNDEIRTPLQCHDKR